KKIYKILNDEIGVTRQQISEMGQSAEGAEKIMTALMTGLDKEFGGGMQRASGNLSVALSNLGIAGKDLTKVFGDQFNDSLTDLTNSLGVFLESLKPIATILGQVLNVAIFALAKTFEALNFVIAKVSAGLNFMRHELADLGQGYLEFMRPTKDADQTLADLEKTLGENITAMKKAEGGTEEYKKSLSSLKDELEMAEFAALGYNTEFAKILKDAGKDPVGFPMIQEGGVSMITDMSKETQDLADTYRKLKEKQADVKRLDLARTILNEKTAMEEYREKVDALNFAFEIMPHRSEEIKNALFELNPTVQILKDNFDRAFDGIAQSIADAMTEGKNAMDSFKDVARAALNSIIRDFIRLQMTAFQTQATGGGGGIMKSIVGGIGSIFGGMFGGYSASSFQGVSASGTTNVPMSARTGPAFGGLAGGGRIAPDMPTLVGERGAELFVPNTSGKIIPKSGLSNALGGNQTIVNQTINVSAGVAQTIRAEMMNMLPQFKQETMAAVAESRLRGGEFANAFTGA
ncbi:MAG TPA: hypothetical protein DCG23_06515, partial [Deltaproteobacteria bacterium]|nr:hypothetical protein [Deltaproteobacteria bacterium]